MLNEQERLEEIKKLNEKDIKLKKELERLRDGRAEKKKR